MALAFSYQVLDNISIWKDIGQPDEAELKGILSGQLRHGTAGELRNGRMKDLGEWGDL